MAERCLLHKNKLYILKGWLSQQGYKIQPTKGLFEVLRATKEKQTVIIYQRPDAIEHLTVQQKDARLIRRFIRETREA